MCFLTKCTLSASPLSILRTVDIKQKTWPEVVVFCSFFSPNLISKIWLSVFYVCARVQGLICVRALVVETKKLQDECSHVFDERMKEKKRCSIILVKLRSKKVFEWEIAYRHVFICNNYC